MDKKVYRYKFSENYLEKVHHTFLDAHRFDEPEVFKAAWDLWVRQHSDAVDAEERRLIAMGYIGNCADKMYKSVRYYFKNKATRRPVPKKRRHYVRLKKSVLTTMDDYIVDIGDRYAKPADSFAAFVEAHPTLIAEIKAFFLEKGVKEDYIDLKIKKTYKNRCFKI